MVAEEEEIAGNDFNNNINCDTLTLQGLPKMGITQKMLLLL